MSGSQSTVLVTYTQEAAAHSDRCRKLADRLRGDGIEAWIDQYKPAPPEGWPRWMQQQIVASTFVILVCTPTFRRRFEGTESPGVGHGATLEGLLADLALYDNGARNEKIVPVLFDDATAEAVPTVLRPFARFTLWADYDGLYRHLTAQPATVPLPVATRKAMPLLGRRLEDTGFLGTPFESVRSTAQAPPAQQIFLNVWFPKFEPRAPRFRVDEPIEMLVDLGPQRYGVRASPLSEDLRERLRQVSQIDVWVQCADADVTPCDGTLRLPWPTNVLSFELTPRRVGGLRIVVVLMIHNQPVHRLEREVQVADRRERGERWG